MARGKSTPRRNQLAPDDDDFSPTSPSPSSPSSRRPTASLNSSPARSALARAQEHTPGSQPIQKKERGPLAFEQETSYHQRLRSLLGEHKKARKQWNELVIRGLVGRVRAALELWTDVELALRVLEKQTPAARAIKAGYLFAQSAKLSEQIAAVEGVYDNLQEVARAFSSICERSEWLLTEVSKTRGIPGAYQQAMWVTWPLSRFVDGLISLSAPYADSLTLIRSLLDTLLTFPPLPTLSDPASPEPTGSRTPQPSQPPQERPSNEQLQAAMSLLAVQPLLPGKMMSGSSEAWEEVLGVEVGGWA